MAKVNILPEDILNGFSAAISINVPSPKFDSQAKVRLSGREVEDAVYNALLKEFKSFIDTLSEEQKKEISTKIINNAKVRQAAEVAKVAKKKSIAVKSPVDLPSNLVDCLNVGDDNAELYIVEGLSAMGTVVQARNAYYQAVLPIRGKILNVMKIDFTNKKQLDRFNKNAEIADIIKALGCGMGKSYDSSKLRYGRVVIAADSDTDGFDIATLLCGVFYRLFPKMFEEGRVYQAMSPLFEIKYRKNGSEVVEYAANDGELVPIEKRLKSENIKYNLYRCKGLGELSSKVFHDTVLLPQNRRLVKINMSDAKRASDMLETAIGNVPTEDRKKWMESRSEAIAELGLYI